jgi:tRNA 2-thiouridine synthesizing protein A
MTLMPDETLDLTGLKCPLPALMARRALARLAPRHALTVITTDPLAVVDIPHMCGEEGHSVENVSTEEGRSLFVIRVKAEA